MAGLFNSYYYGKAGKADFTVENLPTNRWQLFCQTLRVRLSGIIGVNLLFLLFCIPAILWSFINYSAIMQLATESLNAAEAGAEMTTETASGTLSSVMSYLSMYLIGMIPCLGIAGIGSTGEMYVLRNWARDDHSFMMSDFKDAIKGNWKTGLLVGLLNGASLYLCYVGYMFYGDMAASSSVFFIVPQMFVVMVVIVWWMMNMLIFPMMVTYDMKFRQLIRNCAIISIARLPWSILWLVASVVPAAAIFLLVPNYGPLIVIVLYLLIGFGFTGFVYASYANACFDRFLNPRIEGAPVNKGIHTPEEEDEEDDDITLEPRIDYSHPPLDRFDGKKPEDGDSANHG